MTFCFLALQLYAEAPPKPTPLKTPIEASVTFELANTDQSLPLCWGARFSHAEIATSQSCLAKLNVYFDAGSSIHAISSHGKDYGEVYLPETSSGDEVSSESGTARLAIIMLKTPKAISGLWPAIQTDESTANSIVNIHRKSLGHERTLHKRAVTSQAILGKCEGELCKVQSNNSVEWLNDGEPVFSDNKLLCISTEEHCIKARSLISRSLYIRQASDCANSINGNFFYDCKDRNFTFCQRNLFPDGSQLPFQGLFGAGTCRNGNDQCLFEVEIQDGKGLVDEEVFCPLGTCEVNNNVIGQGCTCVANYEVLASIANINSKTPSNCIPDAPRDTPWYATTGAIAGFASAGFVLVCVAPCAACTLCICCGCSACCQGCAMCAKSKTTVNNKIQMQQLN